MKETYANAELYFGSGPVPLGRRGGFNAAKLNTTNNLHLDRLYEFELIYALALSS